MHIVRRINRPIERELSRLLIRSERGPWQAVQGQSGNEVARVNLHRRVVNVNTSVAVTRDHQKRHTT